MGYEELLVLFISPFVGSFLGCLADRLSEGRPIIISRSTCDSCGHVLQANDLVPIASWLTLRAKCRYCSVSISPYYPAVELATLAVSLSAILTANGAVEWVTLGLGWALVVLAAMDLRHLVLSDSLMIGLMVCGLAAAALWSQFAFIDHLLGALIGGVALYCINLAYRALRHRDGLGMGDVKLLAATGAWVAWQNLPTVLLYASFSALTMVLIRRWIVPNSAQALIPLPFGAYICFGFWLTWLYGPLNIWST